MSDFLLSESRSGLPRHQVEDDVIDVDAFDVDSSDQRRRRETRSRSVAVVCRLKDDEYHEIDGHRHIFLRKNDVRVQYITAAAASSYRLEPSRTIS